MTSCCRERGGQYLILENVITEVRMQLPGFRARTGALTKVGRYVSSDKELQVLLVPNDLETLNAFELYTLGSTSSNAAMAFPSHD